MELIKRVKIPVEIKSGNFFSGKHWAIYRKYYNDLQLYMLQFGKSPIKNETKKCKLIITGYRRRMLDYDNFVKGCKPIPDILKRWGWIVDDRDEWLEREYRREKNNVNDLNCTYIELWEI